MSKDVYQYQIAFFYGKTLFLHIQTCCLFVSKCCASKRCVNWNVYYAPVKFMLLILYFIHAMNITNSTTNFHLFVYRKNEWLMKFYETKNERRLQPVRKCVNISLNNFIVSVDYINREAINFINYSWNW